MNNAKNRKTRIQLPAGCSLSAPSVYPKNWKTVAASCKEPWYISYRFYDPVHKPAGHLVIVKGMNHLKTARERAAATQRLISDELARLQQGYNPLMGTYSGMEDGGNLDTYTPLLKALRAAETTVTCAEYTKADIRSMMYWIPIAIAQLHWDALPIGEVRTSHIRALLDKCSKIPSRIEAGTGKIWLASWSPHKYNKYRSQLMILFAEIIECGGVEMNPCRELRKKKTVKRRRRTLTSEERKRINVEIREKNYCYWRFLNIFFHSGARESELMLVQGKSVDLAKKTYTRLIKKDRAYREESTPIKDIAMDLWKEIMQECGPEDYIFSRLFSPGPKPMDPRRVNRVWLKLVKKGMGILADVYSLKHSNSEETTILAGEHIAAAQNAHKSTAMVVQIYDTGRKERIDEVMRKVNNPFA